MELELVKHELYKIFLNKSLCIVIGIFTLINIINFGGQFYYNNMDKNVINNYLKEVEGPITNEKLVKAVSEVRYGQNTSTVNTASTSKEELFKRNLYSNLYQKYAAYEFNRISIDDAKKHMNDTIGYDLRSNALFYTTMTGVQAKDYYYTGGWNYSIGYVYSLGAAMMAALILLGLSSMFSGEYSSRMDSIILSSKYGKTKLIRAKIAASVVYIAVLDLIFNLFNLLGNLIIFGTHGWNAPMQCLNSFMYSPYNFTVFQYYLLQLLIHLGACIVFGLFVMLVSSISKTQVLTFFICTIVFILPFMVDKVIAIKTPLADLITRFSYTWFMQVERLFSSFKVYNILEHPVFYPVIVVVLLIFLVPFCWYFIAKSFKNHSISF
jgi:hypothetical protein